MDCDRSKEILATYRLQLGPDLTFDRVCELLPYFRRLGISHMYLSPCLKAAAGSMHGYDVVDPSEVDPKLGGQEGFDRLCQVSAAFGIGLVLDILNGPQVDLKGEIRQQTFSNHEPQRTDTPDRRSGPNVNDP